MTQQRIQKKAYVSEREAREMAEDDAEVQASQDAEAAELLDDTDALLDEIDDLLEVNAEEFVRNYIQKGGE